LNDFTVASALLKGCYMFLLNWEKKKCLYLILSAVPAAGSLKPWSWAAANPGARNAIARICKSRCLSLRTGAVEILPLQAVRAAVQAVPAVPAPAAAHAINLEK